MNTTPKTLSYSKLLFPNSPHEWQHPTCTRHTKIGFMWHAHCKHPVHFVSKDLATTCQASFCFGKKNALFYFVKLAFIPHLLARLFSKKTSRVCHSSRRRRRRAKTFKLTFSNISVITEYIYLNLRLIVYYQGGRKQIGRVILKTFLT